MDTQTVFNTALDRLKNNLPTVSFGGAKVGVDGTVKISSTLAHSNTRELDVSNIGMGNEGATIFAATLLMNKALSALDISGNHIDAEGAQKIAAALTQNNTLRSLHFSGGYSPSSQMGDAGAEAFGDMLKGNRGLNKLDLRYHGIGDKGAAAIGAGVASNEHLTRLSLHSNNIRDEGVKALAGQLVSGHNHSLSFLDLSNNSNIGDAGATALAVAMKSLSSLTGIDLGGTYVRDEGARQLAKAALANPHMTTLVLDGSSLSEGTRQEISAVLKGSKNIIHCPNINSDMDRVCAQNTAAATQLLQKLEGDQPIGVLDRMEIADRASALTEVARQTRGLSEKDVTALVAKRRHSAVDGDPKKRAVTPGWGMH